MKNLLKLTLVLLFFNSCNDSNKSKASEGIINEITGNNEDINEKYDLLLRDLGTKTPLTDVQLIAAFPKKLGKLNASENRNDEPRITSVKSVLGRFGDDRVRLEILDGAGQNAVGAILPLKIYHLNKVTSENNNTIRFSKKERNGILTFGTDRDESTHAEYQSELQFLYDNRFYVKLEGKGMETEALWDAFDINALKSFKTLN